MSKVISREKSPKSIPLLPLLGLASVALMSCSEELDLFVIEAEVQEVCVVDLERDFDGVPSGETIKQVLDNKDLGVVLSEKFSANLYLRGVGINSALGVEDLNFISNLRVEVSAKGGSPVELLNTQGPQEADNQEWFVATQSQVDIGQFISAEDLQLAVEFQGQLPNENWTAKMEICLGIEAAYREPLPL